MPNLTARKVEGLREPGMHGDGDGLYLRATIFDWAKGAGHSPHEYPVDGLKKALPSVRRRAEHHDALPWAEVPAFLVELAQREGVSARCLELTILTAARSGETRGARWAEFDLKAGLWTAPAERMKRGLAHRVPLSPQALAVLEKVGGLDPDLVFPSPQRGKDGKARPMSDMVFKQLFGRMKREGFTTHGFRSSFRDWASESAHAEREVAEAALSHATGNEVERAYARSDLFERRRKLMDAWGRFCAGEEGQVVRMVRGCGRQFHRVGSGMFPRTTSPASNPECRLGSTT